LTPRKGEQKLTQTVIRRLYPLGMEFPVNQAAGRLQLHRSFAGPFAGLAEGREAK